MFAPNQAIDATAEDRFRGFVSPAASCQPAGRGSARDLRPQAGLLHLERSGIRVAEYLTELPAREVLERKLHEAIRAARDRLNPLASPFSPGSHRTQGRPV